MRRIINFVVEVALLYAIVGLLQVLMLMGMSVHDIVVDYILGSLVCLGVVVLIAPSEFFYPEQA